jgi:hypothetical protein
MFFASWTMRRSLALTDSSGVRVASAAKVHGNHKTKSGHHIAWLAASACLLPAALGNPAHASLVTFNLNQDMPGQPSAISGTVDGLTFTLSNPSSGYFRSSVPKGFCLYGVGECDNATTGAPLTSFEGTFDRTVQLISYTISVASFTGAEPTLTFSSAGLSSVESAPFIAGTTRNFSNPFIVPAGSTINYAASGGGEGSIRLSALTIETDPVPVPGPLPVLGATAALAWSRRLRSRIRQLH